MKYLINKKFVPIIKTIDNIGNMFFKKKTHIPTNIQRVLFIRLEHIGDMVMALPAFETFKRNNPQCTVDVLCRTLTAPLLKNNKNVDRIITYDAPWFNKRETDLEKKFKEMLLNMQQTKYDIIFEMHGDPRNIYMARQIANHPQEKSAYGHNLYPSKGYIVGYANRGAGFLLDKVVEYKPYQHNIKQNLDLVSPFCDTLFINANLSVDKDAKAEAKAFMKFHNLKENKFIIINPMSGRKEKDLTAEEVFHIARIIKDYKIVYTGSIAEINKFPILYSPKNIIDLRGKTSLPILIELVRMAKKVYSPDTGIMHIAHAVGTPCTAIFKTTDRSVWGYPE